MAFTQTHTAAETVKAGANVAIETVKEAVEVVKEKTASTVAAMQETAAESAEIVKKNANIALDTAKENYQAAKEKTGKVMEDAACAVLKAVDNVKETGAYISSEAQKHSAETAEIVQKNANIAKEKVKATAAAAMEKGQEGVTMAKEGAAYAKGVGEGMVGAAKGSTSHEETDLHTISRPTPTGESVEAPIEAPHISE